MEEKLQEEACSYSALPPKSQHFLALEWLDGGCSDAKRSTLTAPYSFLRAVTSTFSPDLTLLNLQNLHGFKPEATQLQRVEEGARQGRTC